jgi:hypothetical protein
VQLSLNPAAGNFALELGLGGVGPRKKKVSTWKGRIADLPHMEMSLHGRNLVTLPYSPSDD